MKKKIFEMPSYYELLESLMDMVSQHCQVVERPGFVCSIGLSANEDAMGVLEKAGVLKKASKRYEWYQLDYQELVELVKKKFYGKNGE